MDILLRQKGSAAATAAPVSQDVGRTDATASTLHIAAEFPAEPSPQFA